MVDTDQQISTTTEQPVIMGQLLELFQQLNTRPIENFFHSDHHWKIKSQELYKVVKAYAFGH